MSPKIYSQAGVHALAVAIIRRALRSKHGQGFLDSTDLDFWCAVLGVDPDTVRLRMAA